MIADRTGIEFMTADMVFEIARLIDCAVAVADASTLETLLVIVGTEVVTLVRVAETCLRTDCTPVEVADRVLPTLFRSVGLDVTVATSVTRRTRMALIVGLDVTVAENVFETAFRMLPEVAWAFMRALPTLFMRVGDDVLDPVTFLATCLVRVLVEETLATTFLPTLFTIVGTEVTVALRVTR